MDDDKKNKVNFYDIMNDPDYFEINDDVNGKDFFICISCGFIPKGKIDTGQTKFFDAHCKCGDPVTLASFGFEELELMENDRIELQKYKTTCRSIDDLLKNMNSDISFKAKFPKELLNEIKWKGYDLSKCTIYYINRGSPNDTNIVGGKEIIEIGRFLILEGDPYERYIPYHRIIRIEYDNIVIFDKNNKERQ